MRRAFNSLRQNRLLLQLLFTLVAAASLAGISVVVIVDSIRSAESVVLGEAMKTVASALRDLKEQQQYRASSDPTWAALPEAAKDVSLRPITETVLRSYPGVEGGYFSRTGEFLGYGYPTHDMGPAKRDVPVAERGLIEQLAKRSLGTNLVVHQLIRGKMDLVVIGAVRNANGRTAIWAMKRLSGQASSNEGRRAVLLGILAVAALMSIAGTLATGISLTRGVSQIKRGLSSLEENFAYELPERQDELGSISRSINRMAAIRRKLDAEMRREDRLRALGRLAAGLAHEIRNPLNSIRLTVQLMEQRLGSGRLRPQDLQIVQTEVDRLSALLNDLLDLERVRQPEVLHQPVLPVLQHCLALVQRQADRQGVRLEVQTDGRQVSALFDAKQLTQTIMNLLLNALDASGEGGVITIRVSELPQAVRVEVEDHGPGLDAEQEEHLFEPFYTTKPSGAGLGLAVSRGLMESQGGELSYSTGAHGARFVATLKRS